MQQHLRSLFLGLSVLLITFAAQAQEGIYDIELVIFEQPADGDDEAFPEAPELPDTGNADVTLGDGAPSRIPPGSDITLLPLRDGRLGPSVYTLGRKGARVLAHLRWRQEIARATDNPWYHIQGRQLDGLIRLQRGRYIHLNTDLAYDREGQMYRVQEHVRARSGKLYYGDHPKLGILFRADRWEDPNAIPEVTPVEGQEPEQPAGDDKSDNPPEQRAPAGELPRAMPDPT